MKILLINNKTAHKKALLKALQGHSVEIQKYQPGLEFNTEGKDLIILSGGGGEGHEIDDELIDGHLWYKEQMDLIRRCKLPILGLCMGFEIICRAFGSEVEEMPKVVKGKQRLTLTKEGKRALGAKKITQHESHKWRVKNVPEDFDILANSPTGIEIIKHKTRPILATQFHPELGGTLSLKKLIAATS
jgi:para-aminobenzoate synthetase